MALHWEASQQKIIYEASNQSSSQLLCKEPLWLVRLCLFKYLNLYNDVSSTPLAENLKDINNAKLQLLTRVSFFLSFPV